jgi:hypothetical protein
LGRGGSGGCGHLTGGSPEAEAGLARAIDANMSAESRLKEPGIDSAAVVGLGGLVTTLVGSLGASYLASRSQRELRRVDELRATLDDAAAELAAAESSGRLAWRAILEIPIHDGRQFEEYVRDFGAGSDFPQSEDADISRAVEGFAHTIDRLQVLSSRLELRLGSTHPVTVAYASARARLASSATTMAFGAAGVIAPGGSDLANCLDEYIAGLSDKTEFLVEARRLIS